VVEAFTSYCEEFRIDKTTGKNNFAIVQAEDELAAIGMVIGANWNGARAFTATSGPGVSLMSEFLGLAYYAEIPTVLIDVQRVGPSTGMPTKTQQSDLLKAAYASHGDTKHVLVIPSDPKECFELTAMAFDLTEQLQQPVIIITDLDIGMNDHMSAPFVWDDKKKYDRGKVMTKEQLDEIKRFGRYLDVDNDGITWRTLPGTHPTKGAGVTRGTARDEYNVYTEDPEPYTRNMLRLNKKFDTAKKYVPKPVFLQEKNSSEYGVIFYGSSAHPTEEALDILKEKGTNLDAMRIRAFPFSKEVEEFIAAHKKVFVVEQNRDAQLKSLMVLEMSIDPNKFIPVLHFDGMPITADFIAGDIEKKLKSNTVSKAAN
jgi:2-oxoglutarate ferredoxin oxidoreductase subunit alpha